MPKSNESKNPAENDEAAKAAAEEAAKKAAAEETAKADEDDGLRPRRPAKVDKAKVKVVSKGKTAQVLTDGVHVWKEATK